MLFCEDDNTDTSVRHVCPICYTHEGGTIANGAECHKYVSKNNKSLLKCHSLQNIEPATQTEKCTSGVSNVCQMQKLYVNFITLLQSGNASISPLSPLNIIRT